MRIGLPFKFVLSISIIIIITSLSLTGFFIQNQTAQIKGALEQRCGSLAKTLATNSEYGVLTGNSDFLNKLTGGMITEDDILYSVVYDKYGVVLSSSLAPSVVMPSEIQALPEATLSSYKSAREQKQLSLTYLSPGGKPVYDVVAPIIVKEVAVSSQEIGFVDLASMVGREEIVGAARVGISMSRMNSQIANIRKWVFFLTVAVAFFGILLSSFLVRIIVNPLRELAVGTEKIARGDLEYRVAIASNDEIGDLSHAFNQMAEDLTRYVKALNKEKEDLLRLKKELEERTRELESTLDKMKTMQEELLKNEKFATIGRLASSVAHELRNPMTSLKNISYYLLKVGTFADEKAKHMLEMLSTDVARSNKIITDLLDFSRIKKINKSMVGLEELMGKVIEQVNLPETITVVRRIDPVAALMDPDKMTQVLINLLSNARDSMGGSGIITISVKNVNGLLGIIIEDTGCGMDKETADHIFEPLFTTKTKGLGLGLAIVKEIIDAHSGTIRLSSEAGKGTTFTIILPLSGGTNG